MPLNLERLRRSNNARLRQYERFGIRVFTEALKAQAVPNPSAMPMQEAYIRFYQEVFVDAAKREYNRIRMQEKAFVPSDFFLNTWREWIKSWVIENLGFLITEVTETTRKRVQAILGDAIEQGLNPTQTQDLLLQEIPDIKRARAIARTESTRANNMGKKRSATEYANQSGDTLYKVWIWGGSREPRLEHVQLQNKPIKADQNFIGINDKPMDIPGDRQGGPENTINCSCSVVYISERLARRRYPDAFKETQRTTQENIIPNIEAQLEFIPTQARYTDLNQFKAKLFDALKDDKITVLNDPELVSGKFGTMQNAIAEMQGFRGLPKVLKNDEFLKLAKDDQYSLIYRGVEGLEGTDITANKIINEYSKGSLYGSKKNIYGNGTYWASKDQYEIALNYGGNVDENVFPALIKKSDMKLGDFSKLVSEWTNEKNDYENSVVQAWANKMNRNDIWSDAFQKEFPNEFQKMNTEMKAYSDFGSWATSKGYDGYTIKARSMAFRGLGIDVTDFIVTLNRTKTIVSESLRGRL